MADITMCPGTDCPNRQHCYRATAKPNEYMQSWFAVIPLQQDGSCPQYIEGTK